MIPGYGLLGGELTMMQWRKRNGINSGELKDNG
jgi:hypothetical protein